MIIDVHNRERQRQFRVTVDAKDPPPVVKVPEGEPSESATSTGGAKDVYLEWDGAFDDEHHLRCCPVCGCRELFARKDFPQVTGFAIVLAAAVVAVALFGARNVIWGVVVLGVVVIIDAIIYLFSGRCLVCYRCRSEFRDTPIRPSHPGWELATGEKYRKS
ncbi:MAG: hypothetical protein WD768_09770 [Phycisphaeraceae bacterium]